MKKNVSARKQSQIEAIHGPLPARATDTTTEKGCNKCKSNHLRKQILES